MKKIIISAMALIGICATAQEKVKVHNGSDSYVTTIEYVTFDATDADEEVSVAGLKSTNETLTGKKSTLEGQVSTLTSEKSTLASEKAALESELAIMKDQIKATGTFGHDYVDLGLPSKTLWATVNVGAKSAENNGDYFAWGETETYYSAGGNTDSPTWKDGYADGYTWSTYKFMDSNVNDENGCTKYTYKDNQKSGIWYDSEGNFIGDNKTELEAADDVAAQTWGGFWQMPTKAMMEELQKNCYWVWTSSYNGKSAKGFIVYKAKKDADKGVIITSSKTASADYNVAADLHIFLPASGCRLSMNINSVDIMGFYWLRSLNTDNSKEAYVFDLHSAGFELGGFHRFYGLTVRPVVPATK